MASSSPDQVDEPAGLVQLRRHLRALARADLAARRSPGAWEKLQALILDWEAEHPRLEVRSEPRPAEGATARRKAFEAWCDGSCSPNPGPGGWGVVIRAGESSQEFQGAAARATNNTMELTAACEALERIPEGARVTLTTDSLYVKNGMTQWIDGWKRKGWITAGKTPVKNRELWERLDALNQVRRVRWQWVRAHAGHPENERCDRLANEARESLGQD